MESITEILKEAYGNKSPMTLKTSLNAEPPKTSLPGIGKPDCPFCAGVGFIMPDVDMLDRRFGKAVPCSCREKDIKVEQVSRLLQISQLGALQECRFDTFIPDGHGLPPAKQRSLRTAYEWVKAFAENPQGWLLIKGGFGCGKTHLAASIANHQISKGHLVFFVNVPDLLDHLRAAYAPNSNTTYDERFEQIKNASLLILDDLGTHSSTEWAQEKLFQIFNYRYNAKLPTVITMNESLETIEIRLQSRLADKAITQVVHMNAPDFRRSGVSEQSELSTLGLHHDKTFVNFDLRERELPPEETHNLRRALEIAKDFAEEPDGWLIFSSIAYGNGKTHLAASIANHAVERGLSVLFVVVPDLLDYLRASFNPNSGVPYDKRFEEIKFAPFLVLDDLGTESATPWVKEKLYQLFNHRYNARLPTIITTSLSIDEIDPRLASRMLDTTRCAFFVLEVPSYRGGNRATRANPKSVKSRGRK